MEQTKKMRARRVTIKDVAEAAGVSIATVSYVLNNKPGQSISEETRKKVLQFANLLGYECNVMAKYLATGKTNTVAAVIKSVGPFAALYVLDLLSELSRKFFEKNIGLRISDYADGMTRGTDCDAFITLALSDAEFYAFADTKYVPVLAIDSLFDDFLFFRITDDYSALAERAKTALGCDDITLLTHALPEKTLDAARAAFAAVTVVSSAAELSRLDRSRRYATLDAEIAALAPVGTYADCSVARKAEAAVRATVDAINRVVLSAEAHNIRV